MRFSSTGVALTIGTGMVVAALAATALPDPSKSMPAHDSNRTSEPNLFESPVAPPEREPETAPRRLYYRQGSDLTDRLEPTDREVVVVQDCCPPTEAAIDGLSRLDLLTRTSDAVVLLRVASIAAHLTPDRDWINSTVTADIGTVLKAGGRELVSGARMVFEVEEGTLLRADTRIVARRTWAVPIEEGGTYLTFLERGTGSGFRTLVPSHMFVTVGNSYRPLLARSDFSVPVDRAREEILQSATLPNLDFGARQ